MHSPAALTSGLDIFFSRQTVPFKCEHSFIDKPMVLIETAVPKHTGIRHGASSEGSQPGSGEKVRRKFSSTGVRVPGYRLLSDHFQTLKRMLAPDWTQQMFCIILLNRRTVSPEFFSCAHTRRPLTLLVSDFIVRTMMPGWKKVHFRSTNWVKHEFQNNFSKH